MGKTRSLHSQINYCISQSCKIGSSKYSDKKNAEKDTKDYIYSVQTAENLRATADSMCRFIKANHTEIKLIKDIQPKHIQEYVDRNEKQWSDKTVTEHISRIGKIQHLVERTYDISLDWDKVNPPQREHAHNVRNVAMSRYDLEHIIADLKENTRRENSLRAVEITSRCGLRSKEVARLKYDNIDIDKKQLHIREGSKGGKHRDVEIRDRDIEYFRELKQSKDHEYVCRGINEDSLNRGIRRSMERLGISKNYNKSTEHAIRKMYATERYAEEHEKGKDSRLAWSKVQVELGHGDKYRSELFKVYIKS